MHNARFLIADDSPVTRLVVTSIIKDRFGAKNIFAVTDGQSAIEILETKNIDFIIADWAMPNLSGENFLTTLRKSRLTRGIPIIVLSSKHDNVSSEQVLALGASQHITKPFQPELLEEKILAAWNPADKRRARRYASLPVNAADLIAGTSKPQPIDIINISQTGILFRMDYEGDLRLFESCRFSLSLDMENEPEQVRIDAIYGQCIRMSADHCLRGESSSECHICRTKGECPTDKGRISAIALHFELEKTEVEPKKELNRLIKWLDATAPAIVSDK